MLFSNNMGRRVDTRMGLRSKRRQNHRTPTARFPGLAVGRAWSGARRAPCAQGVWLVSYHDSRAWDLSLDSPLSCSDVLIDFSIRRSDPSASLSLGTAAQ